MALEYLDGFTDGRGAQNKSRAAWEAHLGRPKRAEDVTEFLFGVIQHPERNVPLYALVVPDAPMYRNRLTALERTNLKNEFTMRTAGWFDGDLSNAFAVAPEIR